MASTLSLLNKAWAPPAACRSFRTLGIFCEDAIQTSSRASGWSFLGSGRSIPTFGLVIPESGRSIPTFGMSVPELGRSIPTPRVECSRCPFCRAVDPLYCGSSARMRAATASAFSTKRAARLMPLGSMTIKSAVLPGIREPI